VSAFRLDRHHLSSGAPTSLGTLCRDACGIQCQVMAAAEMALWARNHRLQRSEIQSALWESRSLVKTALMRGTLHLVSAADFPVYISALRNSRVRQTLHIMARYHISEKEAYAVREAVVDALAAGPMTRRELTDRVLSRNIVGKKGRPWFEQAAWGVARPAILEGLLCYGPAQGQEATFVRVDQWLPKLGPVPEHEARKILLRRYLAAYGPATPTDFSRWTSFSKEETEAVWESLREELIEVSVEGWQGWILREDYPSLVKSRWRETVVRLLPSFDPYLLSHAEKDHLVDRRWYKKVYRSQWWISPVVLLNGRVIGIWAWARRGKRSSFEMEMFAKVSRDIRAKIDEEAARLKNFLAE
jgi:uncharacterized protein YcaQ